MRKLVVIEFLSLDGVYQAPGGIDEDTDGGFAHGGWQREYFDEVLGEDAAKGMADTDAHLFGRRTYLKMAEFWSTAPADDPFTRHLNSTPKYVASRTLKSADWENSTLISGDVVEAVRALKDQPGGTIGVLGSGNLVRTLTEHDLVDEYSLTVSPVVLGGGKRLFPDDGVLRKLELVRTLPTSTGSVILSYRPLR